VRLTPPAPLQGQRRQRVRPPTAKADQQDDPGSRREQTAANRPKPGDNGQAANCECRKERQPACRQSGGNSAAPAGDPGVHREHVGVRIGVLVSVVGGQVGQQREGEREQLALPGQWMPRVSGDGDADSIGQHPTGQNERSAHPPEAA
jgi:hypothetical protein